MIQRTGDGELAISGALLCTAGGSFTSPAGEPLPAALLPSIAGAGLSATSGEACTPGGCTGNASGLPSIAVGVRIIAFGYTTTAGEHSGIHDEDPVV